ncbi:MAG: tetratricopeptide repeat protein [Steroidobacteraceae bacterium]
MKYTKPLLIGALAVVSVAGIIWFLRPQDAPAAASPWIVEAANAFNRTSTGEKLVGGTRAIASNPAGASQLMLKGQQLRVQRRFAEAEAVYRQIVSADPMDADAWADLADSAAAAAGNDLTKGREAIMHAIAIDPRHRKALWLRASLELQEQHYTAAAATWRELESLVPAGSADARVIAANVAEADALAQGTATLRGGSG